MIKEWTSAIDDYKFLKRRGDNLPQRRERKELQAKNNSSRGHTANYFVREETGKRLATYGAMVKWMTFATSLWITHSMGFALPPILFLLQTPGQYGDIVKTIEKTTKRTLESGAICFGNVEGSCGYESKFPFWADPTTRRNEHEYACMENIASRLRITSGFSSKTAGRPNEEVQKKITTSNPGGPQDPAMLQFRRC
jgi:hypothetical protein